MYDKLAGMTGTAMTEASEFHQIYKLGVVPIPTNRPIIRADQPDLVYRTEEAKFSAVVDDIVERNEAGQPVLVGTVIVEKSEHLAALLKKRGVRPNVLNAKEHAREAEIVAQAGRKGAVTVATNMAGRGTDIMLGGNAKFNAVADLHARGLDPVEQPEEYEAAWGDALEHATKAVATEHDEVVDAGGLYVLGTERHESRRIDNQLRGRSGRQGKPASRFYLSMQDDLMRLFNAGMVDRSSRRPASATTCRWSPRWSPARSSRRRARSRRRTSIRKNVLKYDDVLNRQREVIYAERRQVLYGASLHEQIRHFLDDVVTGYVTAATSDGYPDDWDLDQLWTALRTLYPVGITVAEVDEEAGGRAGVTQEMLVTELLLGHPDRLRQPRGRARRGGRARAGAAGAVLSVLDRKWREHLYEMDYLQEGIGLRAMAQRDPLVEYQREGFLLFQAMTEAIEEVVGYLFQIEVEVQPADGPTLEEPDLAELSAAGANGQGEPGQPARKPAFVAKGLDVQGRKGAPLQYSAPTVDGESAVEVREEAAPSAGSDDNAFPGASLNAPCPCGSGKKYKRCHGATRGRATRVTQPLALSRSLSRSLADLSADL